MQAFKVHVAEEELEIHRRLENGKSIQPPRQAYNDDL